MKLLFLAGLLVIAVSNSTAQTLLGVTAGANYSTARVYDGNNIRTVEYRPGAHFGLHVNTVFENKLHFNPTIAYNSRGFTVKSDSSDIDQVSNTLHYISLAPILGFEIGSQSNAFIISAGPILGIAISGKQKSEVAGVTSTSSLHFSTSTDYGLFDLGMQGGIGYRFNKLLLQAHYYYGLTNINNNEEKDKRNIRNRSFGIQLGYYFKSYK